jgi:hypothetical protein
VVVVPAGAKHRLAGYETLTVLLIFARPPARPPARRGGGVDGVGKPQRDQQLARMAGSALGATLEGD